MTLPKEHTPIQPSEGDHAASHNLTQRHPYTSSTSRSLRVYVTDLSTGRDKVNVTIPISLINVGLKLGARLVPAGGATTEDIFHSIDQGITGRVFEMEDLAEGERIEIYIE